MVLLWTFDEKMTCPGHSDRTHWQKEGHCRVPHLHQGEHKVHNFNTFPPSIQAGQKMNWQSLHEHFWMWISQVLSGLSTRNCTRHVMCVYFVNGIWNHGGRTTWKNWKWWILYLNANLNRLVDVPQIIKCNVFLTDVGVIFLKNVISWNDQISVHPGEMVHALVCFYGTLYFQPNFIQQIVSCHNCIRIILGSCLAIAPHVANFQFAETVLSHVFFS